MTAPTSVVPTGPHEAGGWMLTLWELVAEDRARLDPRAAGPNLGLMLWTDFENARRGPVEFDLSSLVFFAETPASTRPDCAEAHRVALEAYGEHGAELVDALVPLHTLLLTVWAARIAPRAALAREVLELRLEWWRRRYGHP